LATRVIKAGKAHHQREWLSEEEKAFNAQFAKSRTKVESEWKNLVVLCKGRDTKDTIMEWSFVFVHLLQISNLNAILCEKVTLNFFCFACFVLIFAWFFSFWSFAFCFSFLWYFAFYSFTTGLLNQKIETWLSLWLTTIFWVLRSNVTSIGWFTPNCVIYSPFELNIWIRLFP